MTFTVVKVIVAAIAATYLPVMSGPQRIMCVVMAALGLADFVSNDLGRVTKIRAYDDSIEFVRLFRSETFSISDLQCLRHPWYDLNRVWITWRFEDGGAVLTNTLYSDLTGFIAQLSHRAGANFEIEI